MSTEWTITCNDSRKCFLKIPRPNGLNGCPLLTSAYPDGECPFAKEKAEDIAYHTLRLRQKREKDHDQC